MAAKVIRVNANAPLAREMIDLFKQAKTILSRVADLGKTLGHCVDLEVSPPDYSKMEQISGIFPGEGAEFVSELSETMVDVAAAFAKHKLSERLQIVNS